MDEPDTHIKPDNRGFFNVILYLSSVFVAQTIDFRLIFISNFFRLGYQVARETNYLAPFSGSLQSSGTVCNGCVTGTFSSAAGKRFTFE